MASARLSVRDAGGRGFRVPLSRSPSLHHLRDGRSGIVRRFSGSTQPSDFLPACMSGVRPWASTTGPPDEPGAGRISRFPCKEFPRMRRVFDCAGTCGARPASLVSPSVRKTASASRTVVSQLDGWPACAPVNASPLALRTRRMTRGHRDWLGLQCQTLSFFALCRFIPALCTSRPTRVLAFAMAGSSYAVVGAARGATRTANNPPRTHREGPANIYRSGRTTTSIWSEAHPPVHEPTAPPSPPQPGARRANDLPAPASSLRHRQAE